MDISQALYECYPNLTVYEFNYDYIMSMIFFDSTVVAANLVENLLNTRMNVGFGVSKSETEYQMRIGKLVDHILERSYQVDDCYFTFSNEEYNQLMNEAELKRSNMYASNNGTNQANEVNTKDILDTLNLYDNNATVAGQIDTIKATFSKGVASLTEEVLPEDKYNFEFNLISYTIKQLTNVLVETLLSPKIVLLFEVNKALMGDKKPSYSIEEFMKSILGMIVAIVNEIRDMIIKSLMDFLLDILRRLLDSVKDLLISEQLEYFARLMKLLFKACSFGRRHRANLDSKLDEVEGADIDEVEEQPLQSEC